MEPESPESKLTQTYLPVTIKRLLRRKWKKEIWTRDVAAVQMLALGVFEMLLNKIPMYPIWQTEVTSESICWIWKTRIVGNFFLITKKLIKFPIMVTIDSPTWQ